MDHLKKWWVGYGAVAAGSLYAVWPQVREVICTNPKVSGGAIAAIVIGALIHPSPAKPSPTQP